ncbi:MAG: hypothetical protein IJU28_06190 [Clostridia bacterium]|nr:hypothetical protein [Clostridia bacterium]
MSLLVQSTKGKLKPLIGFGSIILSVVSLFLLDGMLVWLNGRGALSATAANVLIGGYALILFLLLLYFLGLSCVYTLDAMKLTFSRVYIKNPRLSEQIMLREILFFGSVEDSRAYAFKCTQRFTARRGNLPTRAIVYKREGKIKRILFSPNEEIAAQLRETVKNKKP